jgi:hypothetical protein
MKYRLFIEGKEIDLDPATIIAVTLQATGIGSGSVTDRLTSYTNQISVPKTALNVLALDFSDSITSSTDFPYVAKSFRFLSNGLSIMAGAVIITDSNEGIFNLQFYGELKGLSITLGNSVLSDLDFGDTNVTWDQTTMDALRNQRSGFPVNNGAITAPVVNYGQIDPSAINGSIGDYNLPCVVYKSIVAQIFLDAGYTPFGDFYDNDDFFNRMVMTYGKKSWPGTSFKTNEILPDHITQIDFLKDFLIRFGVFLRFSADTVELLTLEDILNDTSNALKWTEKNRDYGRGKKRYGLSYNWPGWAQVNKFTYPSVNPDTNLIPFVRIISNDGSIDIANTNIDLERDVYESIFFPHQSMEGITTFPIDAGLIPVEIGGVPGIIYGATCPVYTSIPAGFVFDNEPKPMLCLLRDKETFTGTGAPFAESDIYYDGNLRSDYKIAFFAMYPADVPITVEYTPVLDNMRWRNDFGTAKGFLDLYYPKLETVLDKAKKVTYWYNLTDVDISELDLYTLVFDTDTYYLISKVYEFVPGRMTKVDLLKV